MTTPASRTVWFRDAGPIQATRCPSGESATSVNDCVAAEVCARDAGATTSNATSNRLATEDLWVMQCPRFVLAVRQVSRGTCEANSRTAPGDPPSDPGNPACQVACRGRC